MVARLWNKAGWLCLFLILDVMSGWAQDPIELLSVNDQKVLCLDDTGRLVHSGTLTQNEAIISEPAATVEAWVVRDDSNQIVMLVEIEDSSTGLALGNVKLRGSVVYSDPPVLETGDFWAFECTEGNLAVLKASGDLVLPFPAPASVAAQSKGTNQIDLTWEHDWAQEEGFKVERSADGLNFSQIAQVGADVLSYSDQSGLSEASHYSYRVTTYNTNGESYPSLPAQATTWPMNPSNLALSAVSPTQIDLTWEDQSAGEDGVAIYRSFYSTMYDPYWVKVGTATANATAFSDTSNITENTTYIYKVHATLDEQESTSTTAPDVITPLFAPDGLGANTLTTGRVDLAWVDHSQYEDGYVVERSEAGAETWAQVGTKAAGGTVYSDGAITGGLSYDYRVRAFDTGGLGSDYCQAVNVSVPTTPQVLQTALDDVQQVLTCSGDADWTGQIQELYSGDSAIQSGQISHGQTSEIQITVNVSEDTAVVFWWSVSSEEGHDFLSFYVDGQLIRRISGLVDWEQVTYRLESTKQSYTLKWVYSKDESISARLDCGWLDKLEFFTDAQTVELYCPTPPDPPADPQPPTPTPTPTPIFVLDDTQTGDLEAAAYPNGTLELRGRFTGQCASFSSTSGLAYWKITDTGGGLLAQIGLDGSDAGNMEILGEIKNLSEAPETCVFELRDELYNQRLLGIDAQGNLYGTVKTPWESLSQPLNLSVTPVSNHAFYLNWDACEYATNYSVWRSETGQETDFQYQTTVEYNGSFDPGNLNFGIINASEYLAAGTTYYYRVYPHNHYYPLTELSDGYSVGSSPSSAIVSGVTMSNPALTLKARMQDGSLIAANIDVKKNGSDLDKITITTIPTDVDPPVVLSNYDYNQPLTLVASESPISGARFLHWQLIQNEQTIRTLSNQLLTRLDLSHILDDNIAIEAVYSNFMVKTVIPENEKTTDLVNGNTAVVANFSADLAGAGLAEKVAVYGGFSGEQNVTASASANVLNATAPAFDAGELVSVTLEEGLPGDDSKTLTPGYVWQFRMNTTDAGDPLVFAQMQAMKENTDASDKVTRVAVGDLLQASTNQYEILVGCDGASNYLVSPDIENGVNRSLDSFLPNTSWPEAAQQTRALLIADVTRSFTGDAESPKPDVIVANDGGQNYIYVNNSTTSVEFSYRLNFGTGTDATRALAVGDLNGDGYNDIVVGNAGQQSKVYFNLHPTSGIDQTDALFSETASASFGPAAANTHALALADYDLDGDLDIYVGNFAGQNYVYLNDSFGTDETRFATSNVDTNRAIPFGTGSDLTVSLAVADFDNNARPDVAVGNQGEVNAVYFFNEDPDAEDRYTQLILTNADGEAVQDNTTAIIAADFGTATDGPDDLDPNNDTVKVRMLDLAVANKDGQANPIYINQLDQHEQDETIPNFALSTYIGYNELTKEETVGLAAADLDQDGDLDCITANLDGNTTKWLHEEGEARDLINPILSTATGYAYDWAREFIGLTSNALLPVDNIFEDTNPAIETDGMGHWVMVWSTNRALLYDNSQDYDDPFLTSCNNGGDHEIVISRFWDGRASYKNSFKPNDNDTWKDIDHDLDTMWTPPVYLYPEKVVNDNSGIDLHDRFPSIATDGKGNWACVWSSSSIEHFGLAGQRILTEEYYQNNKIYIAYSSDEAKTWIGSLFGKENGLYATGIPKIYCDKRNPISTWIIVFPGAKEVSIAEGRGDYDLYFSKATTIDDHPATWQWTDIQALNTNADGDFDGFGIDSWNASELNLFYQSPGVICNTSSMYQVLSSDGLVSPGLAIPYGWTWFSSADRDEPQSYDLATDGHGNWCTVWLSFANRLKNGPNQNDIVQIGWDADILFSFSADNGEHWSNPYYVNSSAEDPTEDYKVGMDTNNVAWGCFDLDPSIDTDGSGKWIVVWYKISGYEDSYCLYDRSKRSIYISESTTTELQNPNNNGYWNSSPWSQEKLFTNDPSQAKCYNPEIINDRSGNWIIAWTRLFNKEEHPLLNPEPAIYSCFGGTELECAVSTDNAVTWENKQKTLLHQILGDNDYYWDYGGAMFANESLRLLADPSGNFMMSWSSQLYNRSSGYMYDRDIMTARTPGLLANAPYPFPIPKPVPTPTPSPTPVPFIYDADSTCPPAYASYVTGVGDVTNTQYVLIPWYDATTPQGSQYFVWPGWNYNINDSSNATAGEGTVVYVHVPLAEGANSFDSNNIARVDLEFLLNRFNNPSHQLNLLVFKSGEYSPDNWNNPEAWETMGTWNIGSPDDRLETIQTISIITNLNRYLSQTSDVSLLEGNTTNGFGGGLTLRPANTLTWAITSTFNQDSSSADRWLEVDWIRTCVVPFERDEVPVATEETSLSYDSASLSLRSQLKPINAFVGLDSEYPQGYLKFKLHRENINLELRCEEINLSNLYGTMKIGLSAGTSRNNHSSTLYHDDLTPFLWIQDVVIDNDRQYIVPPESSILVTDNFPGFDSPYNFEDELLDLGLNEPPTDPDLFDDQADYKYVDSVVFLELICWNQYTQKWDIVARGQVDADWDDDGLSDYEEVRIYKTSPTDRDTDDDGLYDGEEVLAIGLMSGRTPTSPVSGKHDTDSDRLDEGLEVGLTQTQLNARITEDNTGTGQTKTVTLSDGTTVRSRIIYSTASESPDGLPRHDADPTPTPTPEP